MLMDATDGKPKPPIGAARIDAITVEVQVVCVARTELRATPVIAAVARIAQRPIAAVTRP
jgi:hypothetical protein